jgi:general secretion pathway protein M
MLQIKLAQREKYIVAISVSVLSVFLIVSFLVFPFFKAKERLKKGIIAKEAEMKEIATLGTVYKEYQKSANEISGAVARRGKGFTLMTYLDNAAGDTELKDFVKNVNPSPLKGTGPFKESDVEIKLEGINPDQMVKYLYRVEKPDDMIFIKRITVTDNKKQEGYLDLTMQVMTFEQ